MNPIRSKFFCLNAPSGFGKSYLINALIQGQDDFIKKLKAMGFDLLTQNITVSATTNKAANQIAHAETIHKLIGLKPLRNGKLSDKGANEIYGQIIIIDEASYVSKELFEFIDKYLPNCKVIFVGDDCQLKGVGCSFSVFEQGFPTASLDVPMRQDPKSDLYKFCQHLRECVKTQVRPTWMEGEGIFYHDDDSYVAEVTKAFQAGEDVRLLCYHNREVDTYNAIIMNVLGKKSMFERGTRLVSQQFTEGLLHLDAEVVVQSTCAHSDPSFPDAPMIMINHRYPTPLGDWYQCELADLASSRKWGKFYPLKKQFCVFNLGYSMTTYKSQGSTYEKVIIDMRDIHKCTNLDQMLRQTYVGISRASREVHILL